MKKILFLLVVLLSFIWCPSLSKAQVAYSVQSVTDLGTLWDGGQGTYGGGTYASGINNLGQVVGCSFVNNGANSGWHLFLWGSGTGIEDLGTLGGWAGPSKINDSGQIAGYSEIIKPESGDDHAFLWTAGSGLLDIGTLGGASSVAYGINAAGQIVGWSQTASLQGGLGFIYDGTMKPFPGSDKFIPFAINDAGMMTGRSSNPYWLPDPEAPVIWDNNNIQYLTTTHGAGVAINASGQVAGYLYPGDGTQPAFLWDSVNGMVMLGALGEYVNEPCGLNDTGQVVGFTCLDRECYDQRAVLWTNGQAIDLNNLIPANSCGFILKSATCINNLGQIVATGAYLETDDPEKCGIDTFDHAYLLTPVPSANAGATQTGVVGRQVALDGSQSHDINHNPLTYKWTLASTPSGSHAVVANRTAVKTSFIPTKPGTHVVRLVVSNGLASSHPSTVKIVVSEPKANRIIRSNVIHRNQ